MCYASDDSEKISSYATIYALTLRCWNPDCTVRKKENSNFLNKYTNEFKEEEMTIYKEKAGTNKNWHSSLTYFTKLFKCKSSIP